MKEARRICTFRMLAEEFVYIVSFAGTGEFEAQHFHVTDNLEHFGVTNTKFGIYVGHPFSGRCITLATF